MNFTLSYLEIDRLGEIEGLRANDISPMHDLTPVIGEMKKALIRRYWRSWMSYFPNKN